MKNIFYGFVICVVLCGCTVLPPEPVVKPEKKETVTVKKSEAPAEKKTVTEKLPQPPAAVVLPAPPPAVPPSPPPAVAPQVRPIPAHPARNNNPRENERRNSALWRVFARLSPQEQQEMIKLQRQDQEKFRKIMKEKAELFQAQELARQKELDILTQKYRASANNTEKTAIKAELKKKLQADFARRLADSRRNLEANRKRLIKIEAELQKREKNRDAIVEAILNHRLTGEKPAPPMKSPNPMPGR